MFLGKKIQTNLNFTLSKPANILFAFLKGLYFIRKYIVQEILCFEKQFTRSHRFYSCQKQNLKENLRKKSFFLKIWGAPTTFSQEGDPLFHPPQNQKASLVGLVRCIRLSSCKKMDQTWQENIQTNFKMRNAFYSFFIYDIQKITQESFSYILGGQILPNNG